MSAYVATVKNIRDTLSTIEKDELLEVVTLYGRYYQETTKNQQTPLNFAQWYTERKKKDGQ